MLAPGPGMAEPSAAPPWWWWLLVALAAAFLLWLAPRLDIAWQLDLSMTTAAGTTLDAERAQR